MYRMSIKARPVKFFYDILSPYSYIALEVLRRASWSSLDLQLQPVLLGAIKHNAGTTVSASNVQSARVKYTKDDLHRVAEYYKVDYKPPQDLINVMVNKGSLKAQRLLTATKINHALYLETLSLELFCRLWLRSEDITEDSSLLEACHNSNIPGDLSDRLIAMTRDENIKSELKRTTSEAMQMGIFGVPFFAINHGGKEHTLYGTDRMFLLAYYLGETWPPCLKRL